MATLFWWFYNYSRLFFCSVSKGSFYFFLQLYLKPSGGHQLWELFLIKVLIQIKTQVDTAHSRNAERMNEYLTCSLLILRNLKGDETIHIHSPISFWTLKALYWNITTMFCASFINFYTSICVTFLDKPKVYFSRFCCLLQQYLMEDIFYIF